MTNAQQAASTLLRSPRKEKIGTRFITVKPLTASAFVHASALVSTLPQFNETLEETSEEMISFVLTEAWKYGCIGELIATLAYGYPKKQGLLFRRKFQRLTRYINDELPVTELYGIFQRLFEPNSVSRFFRFTASLSELNILREKRKADQSGS